MNKEILSVANKLEDILTTYLNCDSTDFNFKPNSGLDNFDWKSPIYFVLGHKYATLNNNLEIKKIFDDFLSNVLKGQHIEELINNHEFFNFSTEEKAFEYVKKTIEQLEKLLKL